MNFRYSDDQPRDDHGRWAPGAASEAQVAAIKSYTGGDYYPIQQELRGLAAPTGHYDATIRELDGVLAQASFDGGTVYRGLGATASQALAGQIGKGSVITDKSFVSTTSAEAIARTAWKRGFAAESRSNIVMQIKVPAGAHAAEISGISGLRGEAEVLLPRGSQFRVTSWSPRSRRLGVELVQ